MKKINLKLENNTYPVFIGKGMLNNLHKEITKNKLNQNILVLIDEYVFTLYKKNLKGLLPTGENKINFFLIKQGERSKSFKMLQDVLSYMLEKKYGRDSLIIAAGGGIIGDLAGFAAAIYMRGIQYVQLPTTLLAAVDSSIGGKTGINFNSTKNIIGAFYQPKFVFTDLDFIASLPKEELLCGFGEIVKYSFLSDYKFYESLEKQSNKIFSRDIDFIEKMVLKSVQIKCEVVSVDEKEAGLRKILNLGHTFAHAYESILNYKIKHGEAVIAGLICSIILSERIGILQEEKAERFIEFLKHFIWNKKLKGLPKTDLYTAMLKDKKNREGKIKFVLIKDIGQIITDIEADKSNVIYTLEKAEQFF